MENEKVMQPLSFDELLPPSAKRRVHERIALKIREFAGVAIDQILNPWELAPYVKLKVVSIREIQGLSEEARKQLLRMDGKGWSGGASRPLPNGWRLVFLNPTHGKERQAATLMEECCHVILGHSPTRLRTEEAGENINFRNFDDNQEEVAYAVGAAALVPYYPLKHAVQAGLNSSKIARRFAVSRELVEYRIKVCRLWEEYKHLQKSAG
ncbi:MAG: ImmA/IrrE family metallo-endopeptidase [Acidobacteria bacterium]|nr:ImmA/IrrE family metallo-endopeptidase [Acidobacteriota bacterium]